MIIKLKQHYYFKLYRKPFYISQNNNKDEQDNEVQCTIFFVVKDEWTRNIVKKLWLIEIEDHMYRMTWELSCSDIY